MTITHPFHPLHGRVYRLESTRRGWGEDQVYFYAEDGRLQRLPASWTDAVERDPFVVVAEGRAHFRLDDLLRLAELVASAEENPGGGL
ncbi:MAG TPA: hypothetical protein ENJ50_02910 [Planctomycetaceae bacterium]|nr:hypothetical protein [Planctomycetaceae bacterium]